MSVDELRIRELEDAVDRLSAQLDIPFVLMRKDRRFDINCKLNKSGHVEHVIIHVPTPYDGRIIRLSLPLDDPKAGTTYG